MEQETGCKSKKTRKQGVQQAGKYFFGQGMRCKVIKIPKALEDNNDEASNGQVSFSKHDKHSKIPIKRKLFGTSINNNQGFMSKMGKLINITL